MLNYTWLELSLALAAATASRDACEAEKDDSVHGRAAARVDGDRQKGCKVAKGHRSEFHEICLRSARNSGAAPELPAVSTARLFELRNFFGDSSSGSPETLRGHLQAARQQTINLSTSRASQAFFGFPLIIICLSGCVAAYGQLRWH